MKYFKTVQILGNNEVQAIVCNQYGYIKGEKYFSKVFCNAEKLLKLAREAHLWADGFMKVCEISEEHSSDYEEGGYMKRLERRVVATPKPPKSV